MTDVVTRAEWGATPSRGAPSRLSSTRGVKVHYTGGRLDPRLLDDHDRCAGAVRAIQAMHMNGNGWIDIGYSMVACHHRAIFIGRGPRALCAANGPGLNTAHYSVLGLVGNSGLVHPSDGLLYGIRDAIDYLREHGNAGDEIKGHRDGYATDCPGPELYAWVRRGAPRPAGDTTTGSGEAIKSWTEKLVDQLPTLTKGDDNYDVKSVRALLFARGRVPAQVYEQCGLRTWLERTAFDEELFGLVQDFQRVGKLKVDGIVGRESWGELSRVKLS